MAGLGPLTQAWWAENNVDAWARAGAWDREGSQDSGSILSPDVYTAIFSPVARALETPVSWPRPARAVLWVFYPCVYVPWKNPPHMASYLVANDLFFPQRC